MGHKKMQHDSFATAAEATASAVATKTTYAGSAATVGGWLVSSHAIALIGLGLALLGFIVNLVFKIREDRRQSEVHRIAMANASQAAAAHKKIDEIAESMKGVNKNEGGYGGMPKLPKKPTPPEPVDEGDGK